MSIHRLTIKATVATAIGVVVLAGSVAAQADRAGGDAVTPRVLTFANVSLSPVGQMTSWAEAVGKESAGTLTVEFHHGWREGETDFEASTIADVAAGRADLAFVGARAFDTVGTNSFQALMAPLLVDSHELQTAVFDSGIPQEMLAGLNDLGVVGIVALPGPMIKILGKTHPYVTPSDYTGEVIGIQASALHSSTFEALGATSSPLHADADISGVDGYAKQLAAIWGSHFEFDADYVTANVNLWPRPLILFANAEVFESLDDQQRAAIASAGPVAVEAALEASRIEDADGGSALCDAGMQFPVATDDELAELRTALEPVYEQLAADPETSSFLDAIKSIKADVGAPPHSVVCAQAALPPAASDSGETAILAGPPEGRYFRTVTGADWLAHGSACGPVDADIDPESESYGELWLIDGRAEHWGPNDAGELRPGLLGTYSVFRDRIEIDETGGASFSLHWEFDGSELVLSDLEFIHIDSDDGCGHVDAWTAFPWVLMEG
jgi:TRAP-type C4-dicarboxylate transport system substrate-binding protein